MKFRVTRCGFGLDDQSSKYRDMRSLCSVPTEKCVEQSPLEESAANV